MERCCRSAFALSTFGDLERISMPAPRDRSSSPRAGPASRRASAKGLTTKRSAGRTRRAGRVAALDQGLARALHRPSHMRQTEGVLLSDVSVAAIAAFARIEQSDRVISWSASRSEVGFRPISAGWQPAARVYRRSFSRGRTRASEINAAISPELSVAPASSQLVCVSRGSRPASDARTSATKRCSLGCCELSCDQDK